MNWLKDKLVQRGLATTQISLGQLRSIRRFSVNNYERALNDLTGRVTSGASQQLATAQGLGASTRGLLVGGQVGGGGSRVAGGGSRAVNTSTPYINPTTGTQILPGTGPKGGSGGGAGAGSKGGGAGAGSKGGGNITAPRTGQTTTQPRTRGRGGGLPDNPFPEW